MGDLSSLTNICEPPCTCMFIIMFILTDVPQNKCMYKAKHSHIDANACQLHLFHVHFCSGISWPIPRSDRLFTQLCASWEYHEHALCLSMTWPCNSPMKSAKLRFSLELLWRELLWWKLLWCSELLCALPALHPTSMRSNGQIINAKTPTQWLNANARKTASKHMLFLPLPQTND